MRLIRALLFAAMFVAAPATAQTPPNPVMEHYRAYRAALESGDLAVAATAAEQALAASQARDGDGGRTAVLALNLASVRLMNHEAAGALAPAQRALALAQNAESGVDARHAGLVLGRAELATAGREGAERLRGVLSGPLDGVASQEIYPAASELGAWALVQRDFDLSQWAWSVAATNAAGSPLGQPYGFALARTGEGAAVIYEEIGEGGSGRMDVANAHRAYALFGEAEIALYPLLNGTVGQLTLAERAYGEAAAWRAIIRGKLISDRQRPPPSATREQDNSDEETPTNLAEHQCSVNFVRRPAIEFPEGENSSARIGAVVLRLRFDESGAITDTLIVAYLGSEVFAHAAERTVARWRVVRGHDATPGCQMEGMLYLPVNFVRDTVSRSHD